MVCLFLGLMVLNGTSFQGKKIYKTKKVNPHSPVIDGKIDDPAWQGVSWSGDFIQRRPYEGKVPSQKTQFKILYDDQNLYIALRAHDNHPAKIIRRLARRDTLDGDWMEVNIDSYNDNRTAFSFAVNVAGVKRDRMITNDGGNVDESWDPIWKVKTRIDDQGWIAEMRIPFDQLRFSGETKQMWGLQMTRYLFRMEEESTWQFIPKNAPGWVHLFGELHGLQNIRSKRILELLPYTVGMAERFSAEEGNPFSTGSLNDMKLGLDGKIGLTRDLTLDFTVNPDFGQVEADPSEVNLTTYETFFEEKRPFFIEGRDILNYRIMTGDGSFAYDNLFYSRRIGSSPHYYPETQDGEFVDVPDKTSIIGAFKITGKTKNGLSIGILDSVTSKESAEFGGLGEHFTETVEPLTNYFVLRLQQDYRGGDTNLGGIITATHRDINDPQLNFLHRGAYTGGLDLTHAWKDKTYKIFARLVVSHVYGDREAILNTQESPLRYFQRPDATHVDVDPERTSLTGHGGTVYFGKSGNGSLRFSAGVTWRSPELELNDLGYLRQADVIMQWIWANYRILKPTWIFRDISFNANQWRGWDFSGENIFDGGNIGIYGQFKNYWSLSVGTSRQDESLSSTALRGGPSLLYPGGWGSWLGIYSDNRKDLCFRAGGYMFWGDTGSRRYKNYWTGLTFRPNSAITVSVTPSYSLNENLLQYVSTVELGSENRYIFATINQKTLALTFRLNFSITPDLSIQFYAQPYISVGGYSQFKQIANPRATQFEDRYQLIDQDQIGYDAVDNIYHFDDDLDGSIDYSIENPDFKFLEFRFNLVLRWEYRPGSTVYLVWSQGRTDCTEDATFNIGPGMRDLFTVEPHNVFLIKFTYRFNF